MDAGSFALLQRICAMGGRSLLQYVSESSPFTTAATQRTLTRILSMAQEEGAAIAHLRAYLQKKHMRPVVLGSYPMHYTTLNFLPVEYLLPKLIEDDEKQIATIRTGMGACTDVEACTRIQAYLDIQNRHLQELKELSESPEPAIS